MSQTPAGAAELDAIVVGAGPTRFSPGRSTQHHGDPFDRAVLDQLTKTFPQVAPSASWVTA